jgi:hypothetical protein
MRVTFSNLLKSVAIKRTRAALILILIASTSCLFSSEPADTEFFEMKIRPLLTQHCIACHGEKKQKGGLRLDTKAGWEKGGETGKVIVPKKSKDSLLIKMVQGTPGTPPQMPPDGVLPNADIEAMVAWIESGAFDPRTGDVQVAKAIDWNAARDFWSFKPVVETVPPPAKDSKLSLPIDRFVAAKLEESKIKPVAAADRRTLIRRASFDLTGLPPTHEQIRAFEADTSSNAFTKVVDRLLASSQYGEHQARAWLDVARYGEDQSDKEGDEGKINHAWRYRDWVIEAFNKDVPYDRFVKLQIAADLMEGASDDPTDRRALGFIGLGAIYARPNDLDRKRAEEWDDRVDTLTRAFLGLTVSCARCHDHKYDPIPTQDYYSLTGVIASTRNTTVPIVPREQIAVYDAAKAKLTDAQQTAKDFLQIEADRIALEKLEKFADYAIACWTYNAEKLEQPALKSEDYAKSKNLDPKAFKPIDNYLKKGGGRSKKLEKWYSLLPVKGGPREPSAEIRELAEEFHTVVKGNFAKPFSKRNMDIQNELFGEKGAIPLIEKTVLEVASAEWKKTYAPFQDAVNAAKTAMPPEPLQCNGVAEAEKPADLKVYVRGNPGKHGELAPRRFLRVLAGPDAPKFTRGSGRLDLAEAIADPRNPLTARVMVNRIWQQHFGRGIVSTPSNFGVVGERPSHPELLDYLASQFIKNGWSIKKLHREIMLSETYKRSSMPDAKNESVDPENKWLWKVNRRRLTVESFRDAILSVSGNLDLNAGGPSGNVDDLKFLRRTVYGQVSRQDLSNLLRLFDFPAPNISAERRVDTTLPQQALFLMNSPFMTAQAKVLSSKVSAEPQPSEQIRKAYELALMRGPTEKELTNALKFITAQDPPAPASDPKQKKAEAPSRVERFAQALLASNEFFYVD